MVVTQMLDSYERAGAEVLDIYNAVLDGASSLMLTGETAAKLPGPGGGISGEYQGYGGGPSFGPPPTFLRAFR